MKALNLFVVSSFIFQLTFSQVTFVVDQYPSINTEYPDIYISGDFEGWSGGQKLFKLNKNDHFYSITLPQKGHSIAFKFTQGNWNQVETGKGLESIDNRVYTFKNKVDTVYVQIQNWNKQGQNKSTRAKNVTILSEDFFIPQLNRNRRIWVYLPPNYSNSNEKLPVLYMHDGQNLFDNETSYAGEWEVDETINQLFKEQGFQLIVIGIDHGGEKRIDEFSPWVNSKYGGGEGDQYIDFIVKTLKPYIDEKYRTLSDKTNTGLMGSSLGGLISHYGSLKYPNTFGKSGVFSPSFPIFKDAYLFAEENSNVADMKLYFLAGSDEEYEMVPGMHKMIDLMQKNGFPTNNIKSKIVAKGKHNEALWRNNFKEAIVWLYGLE